MIRTFGRHWPKERARELLPYVKQPAVRAAALELLSQLAPESLKRDLPKFLVHRDPRLRALAIRCLAKIDFQETLAHFEGLLNSGEEGEKQTALENCSFFPFEQMKPILIKFLILEPQLPYIEQVGIILESNPDPEIPFRLWEIAELSSGPKKTALLDIAKKCCDHIEKAGILGEKVDGYLQQLKNWIQEKKQRKWAQEIVYLLGDPENRTEETQAFLEQALREEFQRKALEKVLEWPVAEEVKNCIRLLLQGKSIVAPSTGPSTDFSMDDILTTAVPAKTEQSPPPEGATKADLRPTPLPTECIPGPRDGGSAPGQNTAQSGSEPLPARAGEAEISFADTATGEQIRRLASLPPEELGKLKRDLETLSGSTSTNPELLSSCFRAALRLEDQFLVPQARKAIKHADARVIAVALEYLGKHDIDWVFPYIGQFLKNRQSKVKVAAIKVLRQQDQQTSISNLKNLLGMKDPAQNKTALACLVYFDFPVVREMLFEFLSKQKDPELVQSGLTLFGTNPEPGNLFFLFQLEKSLPEPSSQMAKNIRKESENFLVTSGQLPAVADKTREEEYQRKLRELNERSAKPQESYSYQRLSKLSRIESVGDVWAYVSENSFGKGKEGLVSFALSGFKGLPESREIIEEIARKLAIRYAFPSLVVVLLLLAVGVYALSQDAKFEENPRRGPVLSLPLKVQGMVEQIKGAELTLRTDDGKTFLVQKNAGTFSNKLLNEKIAVVVVPYRVISEQVFEASFQSMEKP